MTIALILSGGTGTRLGADMPKQYIKVNGRPIISYCMETLIKHSMIHGLWVVAAESYHELIKECIEKDAAYAKGIIGFSVPGANRQLSIFNGITDIKDYIDDNGIDKSQVTVLIHDAARPCLSVELISACICAIDGHDGVLPVLPMKDTVYFGNEAGNIESLIDREKVYAGQAPELFRLESYIQANEALIIDKNNPENIINPIMSINGSTEPAIMAGLDIIMIAGDEKNYKITTTEDLLRFRYESR